MGYIYVINIKNLHFGIKDPTEIYLLLFSKYDKFQQTNNKRKKKHYFEFSLINNIYIYIHCFFKISGTF